MTDINQVIEKLGGKLAEGVVSKRSQGGRSFSYVDTYYVYKTMNEIFGLSWSKEIIALNIVDESKTDEAYTISAECRVRITIQIGDLKVIREGEGGDSTTYKKGNRFKAYEDACKSAETDAFKRACMSFGMPLGLALYDKDEEKENVKKPYNPERYKAEIFAKVIKEHGLEKQDAIMHFIECIKEVSGEKKEFAKLTEKQAEQVAELVIKKKPSKEPQKDE